MKDGEILPPGPPKELKDWDDHVKKLIEIPRTKANRLEEPWIQNESKLQRTVSDFTKILTFNLDAHCSLLGILFSIH